MQGQARITLEGNLADHPETKVSRGGITVTTIVVMDNPRYFDKEQSKWCDGESTPWKVTCFREMAEYVAESCPKGARVMVTGVVFREKYTKADGTDGFAWKVHADEIGVSLRRAGAKVNKMSRASRGDVKKEEDPWATTR